MVSLQDRNAFPSTSTEQEPQTPSAQPSFTEIKRASSRRYSSRFLSAATVTAFWFSVNLNIAGTPWVKLPRCEYLAVVLAYLCILCVPERLVAHGVEERFGVTELQPVVLLLLEELFLCRELAEVKYMFIGCTEEDVTRPAIQYLRRQLAIAAVQLLQHRVIAIKAVGCDGYHIVSRSQTQMLCQLDCAQHIADTGGAK